MSTPKWYICYHWWKIQLYMFIIQISYWFLNFLMIPGFELRAGLYLSHIPSLFFALVVFHIRSCPFSQGWSLDCDPSTYASYIAGITEVCHHHLACSLRWSLTNFLHKLATIYDSTNLNLPNSWDYRHELPWLAKVHTLRLLFECYILYWFWQMFNDTYQPWLYHTKSFH
jgi:hypothetical protein